MHDGEAFSTINFPEKTVSSLNSQTQDFSNAQKEVKERISTETHTDSRARYPQ